MEEPKRLQGGRPTIAAVRRPWLRHRQFGSTFYGGSRRSRRADGPM